MEARDSPTAPYGFLVNMRLLRRAGYDSRITGSQLPKQALYHTELHPDAREIMGFQPFGQRPDGAKKGTNRPFWAAVSRTVPELRSARVLGNSS